MSFLIITPFFAQQGTDWKTQGNTADSSSFIGTTNASSLILRTNDVERMRINENGNVGIGVDDPQTALDVEGDIQLTGDVIFKGYEDLQEPYNRFLMIDKNGVTKSINFNLLRNIVSRDDCYLMPAMPVDPDFPGGGIPSQAGTYADWASRIEGMKSILFTGSECPAWVGVGTDLPMTKLDVRGDGRFSMGLKVGNVTSINAGLYIENHGHSTNPYFDQLILVKDHENRKILQLNNDGLLRAREIKVDLDAWPDYVFEEGYNRLPLNQLKHFIEKYGHLPNVPSAQEIEENGLNLGQAAKTSMEKIEELTLYILEINDKVEKQNIVLSEQSKLLEQQKETIRLQQELILELKKLSNKN